MSTSARNAEILRCLKAGDSFGVVARDMGITRSTVAGVSRRAGGLGFRLPTRHFLGKVPREAQSAIVARRLRGERADALAAEYGVSVNYVYELARGVRWRRAE